MMGDAKKSAALLIGFEPKLPKGGKGSDSEEMSGADSALRAAWKAIKADDYEGYCEAMDLWIDAKQAKQDEDEDEDEEG